MQIPPWQTSESKTHLWMDRSSSLLGVWCCGWYQNDRLELYFRLVLFVFCSQTFLFLVFSKNCATLSSKTNFFSLPFRMASGKMLKNPIIMVMIIIHRISVRNTASEFTLWKYERKRTNNEDTGSRTSEEAVISPLTWDGMRGSYFVLWMFEL